MRGQRSDRGRERDRERTAGCSHWAVFAVVLGSAVATLGIAVESAASNPTRSGVSGPWVEQGPGPTLFGQAEGIPNNPVVGAVNAIAAHPTNADILYAGGVNGGIWKTTDATAASPTWTVQTATAASPSIGALEFDPTDASNDTLVAGFGRTSSFGGVGGDRSGLLRTTDGGTIWTLLTAGGTLTGKNVSGIAARGSTIVIAVDIADSFTFANIGIFRSTDTGSSFTQISSGSGAGTGLPGGVAHDLATDPSDSTKLYTSIIFATLVGGTNGLYRSTDSGASWVKVSDAAVDAKISNSTSKIELAVGSSGQVYVGIMNAGKLDGLFRSPDGLAPWTQLDNPTTVETGGVQGIHPGGQGGLHFSIRADPSNASLVYVGGDRQPATDEPGGCCSFPNALGAINFTGRLFRVNASLATGSQASSLTHCTGGAPPSGCNGVTSTTNNSAPHADSREMAFDADGDLIEADDGGVYKRSNPSGLGDWTSVNGNLRVAELHDGAYDTISQIVVSGAQDTGSPEQSVTSNTEWRTINQGDGGDVAIDVLTRVGVGESVRYTSSQFLGGFRRRVVDATNAVQSTNFPGLVETDGTSLDEQFVTPVFVNRVTPTRLLILGAGTGTSGTYESTDEGGTITRVLTGTRTAAAYGGVGGSNVNAAYVGNSGNPPVIMKRVAAGAFSLGGALPSPGDDTIRDIVMDPGDFNNVFAIDSDQVYSSSDAATSWTDITGNLGSLTSDFRSLEYVPDSSSGDALIAAGRLGVFEMAISTPGTWTAMGTGLPLSPAWDLDYDPVRNCLAVATMGRGAWLNRGSGCVPADCDDSNPCTTDACIAGTCSNTPAPATTICRPAAAGGCDVAEMCDGSSTVCPADVFAPSTTSCTGTSQGGACDDDPADHCAGSSNTCVDEFQSSTFVCRADAGECDVEELCTGSSGSCPADAFEPATTSCTGASQGGACDDDPADHCAGASNTCVDEFQSSAFVCRADAGECDVEELCTGSSGSCPADAFEPATTSCTGASQGGACDDDPADHCAGSSNTCVDEFQSSAFVCRADAGECDVEELCTGSSGSCPADVFEPATTSCTGASQGGACDDDPADHCTGVSNACVDEFQSSIFVCRADAGQCDVEELCTGSSGVCPADVFEPATTSCTGASQGDVCDDDPADHCSGASNSCIDEFQSSTFVCRADAGQCDVEERCTGDTGSCPVDSFEPAMTPCDDGEPCTPDDACDGAGMCVGSGTCGLTVTARMDPAPPAGPASPASVVSACSPPNTREFTVVCGASSSCGATTVISPVIHVVSHTVAGNPPVCGRDEQDVAVTCGEVVELNLLAPPCPASGPQSAATAVSVNSAGVKVISGESAVLVVSVVDSCGTTATATYDPATEPSPLCEQSLPSGVCCPAVATPASRPCSGGVCQNFTGPLSNGFDAPRDSTRRRSALNSK